MSLIVPIVESALKVLDKIIPDPQAKAQAQLELLKQQQAGEFKQIETDLQVALGQIEINKVEAASGGTYKGGWRPFIGWVCGVALAYQFVGRPLLSWLAQAYGLDIPPPLDMGDLLTILGGMLGLGVLRTAEKTKGVA